MHLPPQLKISIRALCGDEIALGPGKADLLEAIDQHGSISAAARHLGLSYRRAWLLTDAMNRCWAQPLVQTMAGGAARSGARLSPLGQQVLAQYRALQVAAENLQHSPEWRNLNELLRPLPVRPSAQATTAPDASR